MTHKAPSLFDWNIAGPAMGDAFQKARPAPDGQKPRHVRDDGRRGADHRRHFHAPHADRSFIAQLALWLWFTVLFANFAEAVAEGRGKAQAASLRKTRVKTIARRLRKNGQVEKVSATDLRKGRSRGRASRATSFPPTAMSIEGAATVDESAITGESAPVIRESGGDRSAVTGGTRVLSRRNQHPHLHQPRRRFPGPHDRAGRRRATPENAQRNRAHHPAGGADADLPAGLRDA